VATIVRASKSLLDLCRNSEQPFLGVICPTVIVPNLRLEFSYPVVSGSKLIRKAVVPVGGFPQPCRPPGEQCPE
jgi:hypothetical protein